MSLNEDSTELIINGDAVDRVYLSKEAEDLLEQDGILNIGLMSISSSNAHLVAEVLVKTLPIEAEDLMLEIQSQLQGTN